MSFKIGSFQWAARAEHKRLAALVLVALVALLAGVLLVVRTVRLPAPPEHRAPAAPAAASLNLLAGPGASASQRDRVLAEQAQLFDPAPLFLPTRYNSSQPDAAAGASREPGETPALIEPRLVFPDTTLHVAFPDPYPGPAQPADALDHGITPTPYATFGRLDLPLDPLPPRMAKLEVVQMKTGRPLLTLSLPPPPAPAAPALAALAAADWEPLEFLVALDDAGLIGEPSLVRGSGSPAVNDFFSNYIMRTLRIGARRELGAGFYLLRINP